MLKILAVSVAMSFMLLPQVSFADKLYGTIVHKDGSKVKKTRKISTSWNSKTAKYTADGEYELDFGKKVGKKITVYVDGETYTEIEVKGDTKLNIELKK